MTGKCDEKFDLDSVLMQLGQFGKYQFKNYFFIVIIVIFNAIFTLSYVFTAGNINYR
jgi:MFS transporter, OCT family, solute carrier family 22 (organic cation transporter), member 4/5